MKIGMILDAVRGFPPDIRVTKEATALDNAGITVSLLCRKIGDQPDREDWLSNSTICRTKVDLPESRIRRATDAIRMNHSEWEAPIQDFLNAERPDVLHVHDLPILPTVLKVARTRDIPVVADLHENMPAAMRAYRANSPLPQRIARGLVHNYRLMQAHEARALKRCAKTIVVVPEGGDRLREYGLSSEQIVLVSNTEDETTFKFRPEDAQGDILAKYEDRWVASYIGGIGPHRGIDASLRSVTKAAKEIPNFLLLVVGASPSQEEELHAEVQRLGISDLVEILGWQPSSAVNSYVMASQACLVPHNFSEHTDTTVPHKLFQYMICGKPVVVSDCRPLARIVNDTNSGLIFEAGNDGDLAGTLIRLYKDAALGERLGLSGRAAAKGPYSWKHDAERLVSMYQELH